MKRRVTEKSERGREMKERRGGRNGRLKKGVKERFEKCTTVHRVTWKLLA